MATTNFFFFFLWVWEVITSKIRFWRESRNSPRSLRTVYEILVRLQVRLRPDDALVLEKRPERDAEVHEGHERQPSAERVQDFVFDHGFFLGGDRPADAAASRLDNTTHARAHVFIRVFTTQC